MSLVDLPHPAHADGLMDLVNSVETRARRKPWPRRTDSRAFGIHKPPRKLTGAACGPAAGVCSDLYRTTMTVTLSFAPRSSVRRTKRSHACSGVGAVALSSI